MKFTYFRFKNFKGIEDQTLDLSKNPESNIYTLVGLNESGKTTILEAINFFKYKQEKLDVLELKDYLIEDIHSLIPINKRDNFNDFISIEAGIQITDSDIAILKKEFAEKDIKITRIEKHFSYTQNYYFENSKNIPEKNKFFWNYKIYEKKSKQRKENRLDNNDAFLASRYIIKNLPSILYFPNFLFDFPERIYLDTESDEKHLFYQTIIQDALDSLENNHTIKDHLINRINSSEATDKKSLDSLIGKLEKRLTEVIFKKWNQIFNRELSQIAIILKHGKDEKGIYIEFNIKDDVDVYQISERSLGFRWFFVYILLTQFRIYRKENKNAFFLFDEPASNLHPSAQIELLKSFEKLPSVIYTTHSQYLINPKWLESTFVIKNEAIDYEKEESFNYKNTNISVSRYRNFASSHPNQINYFQPILEVLEYRPSKLDLVPKLIFTEGKNDYYTLNYFIRIMLDGDSLNITPGTSASNLQTLISLYLGWGSKFIVLLDADKEGKKQQKRYIDEFGKAMDFCIFTLKDINNDWDGYELESLITENDKSLIVKSIYPDGEINKITLNRSLQELYINDKMLDFDSETLKNFKLVFEFLKEELGDL